MDLKNAKALVTGGSAGIGKETARLLIEKGAKVAICGRSEDKLEATAKEIGAVPIVADVSVEADVERLVATTVKELSGYNVLINNAGYGTFAPLVEQSTEEFNRLFATNVTGAMMVARESAKHFAAQRERDNKATGNIVNIASSAGLRGFAGGTAYVASKFALRGMTECWRAELRKHNIRVMLVNPSEVLTDFAATYGRVQKPSERKLRGQEIAHTIVSLLEMDDRGFTTEVSIWATNPD